MPDDCVQAGDGGTGERSKNGMARCPECGASAFYPNGGPGAFWCESCEREFWKDGGDWFSCGAGGEYQRVDTETAQDGGRDE